MDAVLDELGLVPELDEDGDWRLSTDVGDLLLLVEPATGDLVAVQTVQALDGDVVDHADAMHVLLALNFDTPGCARFAAARDGEQDLLTLVARIPAADVSLKSVARLLADCVQLSRRLDELVESTPDAPA